MIESVKLSLTDRGAAVLHAHGITPESYGTAYDGESAGLDLYNAGDDAQVMGRTKWSVLGEQPILLPTGVKIDVPAGCVGLIRGRGSIIHTGLVIRGGVIDPGYTGEIFVNLVNIGERDTNIPAGAKLPLQLVIVRCFTDFRVISNLEFLEETKGYKRQAGIVGSSDQQIQAVEGEEGE